MPHSPSLETFGAILPSPPRKRSLLRTLTETEQFENINFSVQPCLCEQVDDEVF